MTNEAGFMNRLFTHKHFNLIAAALIAVLVLAAYSNSFTNSFHFDDDQAISENPRIKQPTAENIWGIISGARSVVYLSLMLNYQLGSLNPVGWHIFNVGVHIITSILVYFFILQTLSLPSLRDKFGAKARWLALFAGLLFAVHPIQTESVTYIISRSELLATCFYMAAFLFFIQFEKTKNFGYALGVLFSAYLAVASKEWAITLPALLFLYDFLFLSDSDIKPILSRWYVYLFAILPWYLVLSRLDLFAAGGTAGVGFNIVTVSGITKTSYLYTSFNVIWTYIRLLFLPINQNIDYDYPIAKTLFELPTILSFVGHLAVVAAGFWLYRTKKSLLIPFGIAWFYIGLSPVQSIVPVSDVIFEHRLYMPSIGFFLFFVVVFDLVFSRKEAVKTEAVSDPAKS
jgi:protein O-mannosyl-transferase